MECVLKKVNCLHRTDRSTHYRSECQNRPTHIFVAEYLLVTKIELTYDGRECTDYCYLTSLWFEAEFLELPELALFFL